MFEYHDGKIVSVANIKNGKLIGNNRTNRKIIFLPQIGNNPLYILNSDTLITDEYNEFQKSWFLADHDQHLWLGTEEGLCHVYSGGFETYKRESLPTVWSILEDFDQNIWFASYNNGLKKFNGKTIDEFTTEKLKKITPNFHFHFHSSVDKRGRLFFPCVNGILAYNGNFFLPIRRIGCLTSFYDRERDLLWGGYRILVEIYNCNQKPIRTISKNDVMDIKGYVVSIGKDKEGFYWLGGFTGLCSYNWDTKELVNYNRTNSRLPADGVMSTFNTPDGRTWFGSTNGLLWYDSKNDSIRKIECEEISGTLSFVTAIDSTWLVFSQSVGIYLMDLQKFNHTGEVVLNLFNENNGFLGIDPGQDGAMVDSKGNIWMTTSTEVVKMDPKKLEFKKSMVNVWISAFNGQLLPYNQNQINLPRNERSAIVQFDAICYNRPNQVQYSWIIDGSGKDWSTWQKEDYVVLTNLPDGQSLFKVKMKVPGLPQTEALATIGITVDLALWKQEWFFPTMLGLVSLLVFFSLVLFLQTRTRLIQTNKQVKMFQLQAILSQLNPHFIFNVMASIQSEILSANIQKANEYLVKMSALIRGFLEASVSAGFSKTKNIKESELQLKKEIEILDHFIQFQQFIYPDRFDYELVIGPGIVPDELTIPPMLIQPFVENSIKHGLLQKNGRGKLKISLSLTKNQTLQIEIEDDGIGMEKADALIRNSHLLYTSRGKELTLKRIKLLNEMGYLIQFRIDSSDSGTKVTLKINRNE